MFRSLKKRKYDSKGRLKQSKYRTEPNRTEPMPQAVIEHLDLVFNIRSLHRDSKSQKALAAPLWSMSRPTAYRLVKRVIGRAGVTGKQATGKELRHGFGVAMVTGKKPLPIHAQSQLMGHSDSKVTEIYLQVVGEEKSQLVADAWER